MTVKGSKIDDYHPNFNLIYSQLYNNSQKITNIANRIHEMIEVEIKFSKECG